MLYEAACTWELYSLAPTTVEKVCVRVVLQVTVSSSGSRKGQTSTGWPDVPHYGIIWHLCFHFHKNWVWSDGEEAFEHMQPVI